MSTSAGRRVVRLALHHGCAAAAAAPVCTSCSLALCQHRSSRTAAFRAPSARLEGMAESWPRSTAECPALTLLPLAFPSPSSDRHTTPFYLAGMAKIMAKEYSGVTGNVGTLAWVRASASGLGRDGTRVGGWAVSQSGLARGMEEWSNATPAVLCSAGGSYRCSARGRVAATPAAPPPGHPTAAASSLPPGHLQAAPEMLLGARCTEKADVYSYGQFHRADGWRGCAVKAGVVGVLCAVSV